MHIQVHQDKVDELLDVILPRWASTPKKYPFNRPDAIVPQAIIPDELRKDKYVLACFYFYACIYMRGGIKSLQAFNALIKMWREYPDFFEPSYAKWLNPTQVQEVLKRYIGWDSKAAGINWVWNSRRLHDSWEDNPLLLIKGLRNYDEALRRIKNKRTKTEIGASGEDGGGFRGFQPKMVSMLLYFYDWEGWLKPRFLYPSPADFHNYRLGFASGAIVATLDEGRNIRYSEKISEPWRVAVMVYMKKRKADPLHVSDALWLFSLTMCGNSPLNTSLKPKTFDDMLSRLSAEEAWDHGQWAMMNGRKKALLQTCLICPLLSRCEFAIPARPYYRHGVLELRERPHVEKHFNLLHLKEPKPNTVVFDEEVQHILIEHESRRTP